MQQAKVTSEDIIASWYEKATVRYTPRILVPSYSSEEFIYPIERSVICAHPLVVSCGREARSYILTQAAYQFLYGVGLLETKFVIKCCLDIIHNRICGVSDSEKLQALTVLIDEGYHAHVALDYIVQMKHKSGIDPLHVPESNRRLDAAARAYASLPEDLHMDFQLLAVTLAENVLTDEIANIGRENGLTKTFTQLMKDHVLDEGRHSNYFAELMKSRWIDLPQETQQRFGAMLPDYLDDFLGVDMERMFERRILDSCGLEKEEVERVIADTNSQFVSEYDELAEKTKARLFRLLKKMGVMDVDANRRAFSNRSYTRDILL